MFHKKMSLENHYPVATTLMCLNQVTYKTPVKYTKITYDFNTNLQNSSITYDKPLKQKFNESSYSRKCNESNFNAS